jgi:hypothetical protein
MPDSLRDVIPKLVFDAIRKHLRNVGNSAQSAWLAANAEDDTLTGDFCGRGSRITNLFSPITHF